MSLSALALFVLCLRLLLTAVCVWWFGQVPSLWVQEAREHFKAQPKPSPFSLPLPPRPAPTTTSAQPSTTPSSATTNSLVDRTLSTGFQAWSESDESVWIEQRASTHPPAFINLLLNPEGYTGYEGKEAWKIWEIIYGANCFRGDKQDFCFEQRVLYRLISGLQSAIAAHTAARYDVYVPRPALPCPALLSALLWCV